jgi:hypothetical protein
MRKIIVLGLVVIGVGAVLLVLSHRSDSSADDAPPTAKPEAAKRRPENIQRPVASSEPSSTQAVAAPANLETGQWTRERDLKAKGFATPRDAYESLLYAATGGDVAGTASVLHLTAEARKRAEKVLAGLPPEKRAEYATPERLVASLLMGSSALIGAQSGEASYQILNDEPGVGIASSVVGLPRSPNLATDPSYRTLRAKTRSPAGEESESVMVFRRTTEGWQWLMPPSMVDAFGRLLKGKGSAPDPKQ